jgi:AcrR family transcriptional regulator
MSAALPLRVPVQPRSQRTRAALVEAASREFSERGYASATAKSIAERARVGTGTFYHYFPDKDAVLRELATERVAYLLRHSSPLASAPLPGDDPLAAAAARLTEVVERSVEYHRSDRGLHTVIAERRLCDSSLDAILVASEREAVAQFETSLSLSGYEGDAETAALMMFSLLEGAIHGHVLTQAVVSESRFVNGLVEALIRIGYPRPPVAPVLPSVPSRRLEPS